MLLKALAEDLVPDSTLVFRGREGRSQPLASLRRALFGPQPSAPAPGRVALTFDDGPTALTPRLLELLAELRVRATFFLIGELCEAQPELVQAIADGGHELASHGYTHRRFPTLSRSELEAELERTSALLPKAGRRPLVRPPYGSLSLGSLLACAQRGFTTVLWSLNSCDWRLQDPGEVTKTTLKQSAAPGEILLFHEGQAWTLEALPAIVGGLRQAGHELVTVGELLD